MILSQASGLVAMVVAVIGDMVAIAPLIDRAPLMLEAIAALRFVRAVLVVVVAVMIGFVDLFVVPFRGVIVLLIAMTARGIVIATAPTMASAATPAMMAAVSPRFWAWAGAAVRLDTVRAAPMMRAMNLRCMVIPFRMLTVVFLRRSA